MIGLVGQPNHGANQHEGAKLVGWFVVAPYNHEVTRHAHNLSTLDGKGLNELDNYIIRSDEG